MTVIQIVGIVVGSSALFSFIQFLIIRHDNKKSNPLNNAVQALLRDRIVHLCEKYLSQGSINLQELEVVSELFASYKELGGNGFVMELVEKTTSLPQKKIGS